MPTGYTADIEKGITFNKFIMDCARAFGACITMRDDPHDKEISDEFEENSYHKEQVENIEIKITGVNSLTIKEAENGAKKEYEETISDAEKSIKQNKELKQKTIYK